MNQPNNPLRRCQMKANKFLGLAIMIVVFCVAQPSLMSAQSQAEKASASASSARWSVQVDKIDAGDINLAPSFQFAIYENLLRELAKNGKFKQVLRDGSSNAAAFDLLVLKTTVQKYSAGSETKRAVTTVTGATQL